MPDGRSPDPRNIDLRSMTGLDALSRLQLPTLRLMALKELDQ
jgi:hypothetical protein